ncbi:MAG: pyridoxal phosphate-dependent aminotransferase [Candidatus Acidiferrales bacterium]
MKFDAFLLDQWIQQNAGAEFDLGGSTGPRWKVRELLALADDHARERALDLELTYPPTAGAASLREAIGEMHGVPAEQVVVLAGSAEALFHVFYLAAEPGANVIVPFPCFPSHQMMPQSLGLEVRHYYLRPETSYSVDLDEVKRLADNRTKMLVVNSPHNPTGATLSSQELKSLHDFATEKGIQFVADEVFHPIYHGRETDSAARLPHATVIGDFSKALSLPGLRLAWVIERDPARRAEYLNAREYVSVSNTPVGEFLGEIAIRNHQKVIGRTREVATANLKLLDRVLAEHSDILGWIRPMGGMTAFARLVSGGSGRAFCEAALQRGLLLAPGDCWGIPDHFRVGFGVGQDWYPRAMDRFAEVLREWATVPLDSSTAGLSGAALR